MEFEKHKEYTDNFYETIVNLFKEHGIKMGSLFIQRNSNWFTEYTLINKNKIYQLEDCDIKQLFLEDENNISFYNFNMVRECILNPLIHFIPEITKIETGLYKKLNTERNAILIYFKYWSELLRKEISWKLLFAKD